MTHDPQTAGDSLFTQVEVTASTCESPAQDFDGYQSEHARLLRELVAAQDRQNELLEELVSVVGAAQRQRTTELNQWKQANPALSRHCRQAAEVMCRVQGQFLKTITHEVLDNAENLTEGEFFLTEFLDRFGPRMAHLNAVIQVLTQLGNAKNAASSES
jgi:hypothetical protein